VFNYINDKPRISKRFPNRQPNKPFVLVIAAILGHALAA
jgi:hypothetical protein